MVMLIKRMQEGFTEILSDAEIEERENRRQDELAEISEYQCSIWKNRLAQTKEQALALRAAYRKPIWGKRMILEMLEMLAFCIDPSDPALYNVSQYIHTLQVADSMLAAHITDETLIVSALVHDIGKVLLLTDERPENVVGISRPIGDYQEMIGLDNVLFQWGHSDFIYSKLGGLISAEVGWIVKYHSIVAGECLKYMSESDLYLKKRYLEIFQRHDDISKSMYYIPKKENIRYYKALLLEYFPDPILF